MSAFLAQFLRTHVAERELTMRTAHYAARPRLQPPESRELTLLALVQEICDESDDDHEVVATVCHLLQTGQVRLCGNFGGAEAEIFRGAGQVVAVKSRRSNRRAG
jgi:hypothetical protein